MKFVQMGISIDFWKPIMVIYFRVFCQYFKAWFRIWLYDSKNKANLLSVISYKNSLTVFIFKRSENVFSIYNLNWIGRWRFAKRECQFWTLSVFYIFAVGQHVLYLNAQFLFVLTELNQFRTKLMAALSNSVIFSTNFENMYYLSLFSDW